MCICPDGILLPSQAARRMAAQPRARSVLLPLCQVAALLLVPTRTASRSKQALVNRCPCLCRSIEESNGDPMVCCGVCQYEGRHCAAMAPPGAMDAHLADYVAEGFDFAGFTPDELWTRIKGEHFSRSVWKEG